MMINQTQTLLKKLSGGEFQQLAAELLPKVNDKFLHVINQGACEGTAKTRTGTPDLWIFNNNDSIICIEATTDTKKDKLQEDLNKNLPIFRESTASKKEYIVFVNFEPDIVEIEQCRKICKSENIKLTLFSNGRISKLLDERVNHDIRLKYLEIQPHYGVFLTKKEFKSRLQIRSTKLPFNTYFIGREAEIQGMVDSIKRENRIILISGDPGVGKTKFCLEFINYIRSVTEFKEYEIRFLNEDGNILNAIHSELDSRKNYFIIADDANRIHKISELFEILLNPEKFTGSSYLLLTTRNYAVNDVIHEIRNKKIESYDKIILKSLSNRDIDQMIQQKPFNIQIQEDRRSVVFLAKGNPRVAIVAAEVLKTKGFLDVNNFNELLEEYFEGIFSEIYQLSNDSKKKRLLAIVAGLRSFSLDDKETTQQIIKSIGFANQGELEINLSELREAEILDIFPSRNIVRIFDDSLSEYLVYRFYFRDDISSLKFESEIIEPFESNHSQKIYENLLFLHTKGFSSKRLKETYFNLLRRVDNILQSNETASNKAHAISRLEKFAKCVPKDSFGILQEYIDRVGIENLSGFERISIIKVIDNIMFANLDDIFPQSFHILFKFAVIQKDDQFNNEAEKVLTESFKYVKPREIEKGYYRFFYKHLEILINELRTAYEIRGNEKIKHVICIKLLKESMKHHHSSTRGDYIDKHKFIMSSGPLYLNETLKNIRLTATNLLNDIFVENSDDPKLKLDILEILEDVFHPNIPFGMKPSLELMHYDASIILEVFDTSFRQEKNRFLRIHIEKIYWNAAKLLGKEAIKTLQPLFEDEEYILFKKFYGSYFDDKFYHKDWKEYEKAQKEFLNNFLDSVTKDNIGNIIKRHIKFQVESNIAKSNSFNLTYSFFFLLGQSKSEIAKSVYEQIIEPDHPLHQYSATLLTGIMDSKPAYVNIKSNDIMKNKDINQARLIAASYKNNAHTAKFTEKDIEIIDALIDLNDEEIDFNIADGLQGFQNLDRDWVANTLLKLSYRISDFHFETLLRHLNPSHSNGKFTYQIFRTHPKIFKKIILNTIRIKKLRNSSYSLSKCLKNINEWDSWIVFIYFIRRTRFFKKNKLSAYDVLDCQNLDLSFIVENSNFEKMLNATLDFAKKSSYQLQSSIDFLTCVLVKGDIRDSAKSEELEFDKMTLKVFYERVQKSENDLVTVTEICKEIKLWKSWFKIVDQIVNKTSDKKIWSSLRCALYSGSHTGITSSFYNKRLELVKAQYQYFDSRPMKRFLKETEIMLEDMIEREIEREYDEEF